MTARAKYIAEIRGQLWYHHLLHVSGLSRSALDRVLDPPEVSSTAVETKRHFKILLEKRTDPDKKSAWRSWSLVDRMAERLPVCKASREVYRSELWDWLLGDSPSIDQIHEWIERELAVRGYFRPTADQAELFRHLVPDSRLFDWSTDYALEWTLHRWGTSLTDVTLAAGLVLEASLARNWEVLNRWAEPLRCHIDAFKHQPWLQSKAAQEEANQLGDEITAVLLDSPKTSTESVDPFIFRVIGSPIVGLYGDAVWFLKWERELHAAYNKRSLEDPFLEGGELAKLLVKRSEHAVRKRKGGIYPNFHRRERR